MYLLEINEKTIFARVKDVYPECEVLITGSPKLHPFKCFVDSCHKNGNCMEKLVHRVKYIFDTFTKAKLLILYYSYPDKPGSIRCGVFWRDFRPPYHRTINRASWELFKKKGTVYQWELPSSFFLTGRAPEQNPAEQLVQLQAKNP